MVYKNKTQTAEQKAKIKFRSSAAWKKFRAYLKKERKVDFITGKKLYFGFQVHHCDLHFENYSNIGNQDNFITVNRQSHEIIHWGFKYDNWEFLLVRLAQVWLKMDKLNDRNIKSPKQIEIDNIFNNLFEELKKHEKQHEFDFE